jgi:hypothetical protein
MNKTLKDVLGDLLTFIDFNGDKQDFIAKFIYLCTRETLGDFKGKVDGEKQEKILKILSAEIFTQEDTQFLNELALSEEYQQILSEKIKKNLEEYVQTITPTLDMQKQQVLQKAISLLQANPVQKITENSQPQF